MAEDAKPKQVKNSRNSLGLSLREIRFCVLYAECNNASQAYREAGYPERPPASTWSYAWDVLRKPEVRAKIKDLRDAAVVAAGETVNTIARGLARSANKDLRTLYDEKGRIKLPSEWDDNLAGVIESVQSEEIFDWVVSVDENGKKVRRKELVGYVRKVKTTNRTEAQKVLAQWKRMIGADKTQDGDKKPDPLVIGGEADPESL